MVMALERAVDGAAPRRSEHELARQKREVAWWIRARISPEESEAMASSGYRCGCAHRNCPRCNDDPDEVGETSRRGKRAQQEARYVREVIARVSLFPRFLSVGVPREMARLPADERLVLLLNYGCGLSVDDVARRLKVSRWTVRRTGDAGLERIARAIWTESGGVRFGD